MSKKKFGLTFLGAGKTEYPGHPDLAKLETVPFDGHGNKTLVTLSADEFTSLCPVTGQPDFGELVIEYEPKRKIVESKSLKLYLHSFRNLGIFQEALVIRVLNDFHRAASPKYIRIRGNFKPRGGIRISPVAERGKRSAQ